MDREGTMGGYVQPRTSEPGRELVPVCGTVSL